MFEFSVRGVVQGVGFRPFIYQKCHAAGLKGYVQNTGDGVTILVDNKEVLAQILQDPPPLARIDSCEIREKCDNTVFEEFGIRSSEGIGNAEIPPDLFLCNDCLRELQDPGDRRHNYFFITCTNCGPRYSLSTDSPYDRATTTMTEFPMCRICAKEYGNPMDRRYHAQTIACHECGPRLTLHADETSNTESDNALQKTAELLKQDHVVAVKGVGGFHLACRTTKDALQKLRTISGRRNKPYALLCKDLDMVRRIAKIRPEEEALLVSVQRPIVLVEKRSRETFPGVSELNSLGIMLPYTGLHYLIFQHLDEPLIMTSANKSDEPITSSVVEQFVDDTLDHDRRISNPIDDSIVKAIAGKSMLVRRARGYVPQSIRLKVRTGISEDILALGAEMNSAFCILKDGRAILSPYLGNTRYPDNLNTFKSTLERFLDFTKARPKVIIADKHPEYATAIYAKELATRFRAKLVMVQHHRAHAYSVAAENGFDTCTAIVCDGLGFGDDGTVWGGEIFVNGRRAGHLEAHRQLGGDSAAEKPAHMLFSILKTAVPDSWKEQMSRFFTEDECELLEKQFDEGFNAPFTTSCGRVLDAAAVLLGLCTERTYDGRPAMLLESVSTDPFAFPPIIEENVLMTSPLFAFLMKQSNKDIGRLAATVQQYLAEGLYELARRLSDKENLPIVFSGGCAYNRMMTRTLVAKGVHVNEKVPSGDGGICFGQIAAYLADTRDQGS